MGKEIIVLLVYKLPKPQHHLHLHLHSCSSSQLFIFIIMSLLNPSSSLVFKPSPSSSSHLLLLCKPKNNPRVFFTNKTKPKNPRVFFTTKTKTNTNTNTNTNRVFCKVGGADEEEGFTTTQQQKKKKLDCSCVYIEKVQPPNITRVWTFSTVSKLEEEEDAEVTKAVECEIVDDKKVRGITVWEKMKKGMITVKPILPYLYVLMQEASREALKKGMITRINITAQAALKFFAALVVIVYNMLKGKFFF